VLTASGPPYALTFLRRTNGALSIRSRKLAGPYYPRGTSGYDKKGGEARPSPLTYSVQDERSIERERSDEFKDTAALVRRWGWHNDIRAVILGIGTVCGALAIALEG
jgi:hypothetical protein